MQYIWILILLCTACSSGSLEDYRDRGTAVNRSIIRELRKINSYNDAVERGPVFRKHFGVLADLMIAAHDYRDRHPDSEGVEESSYSSLVSQQLREEIERVYRIDGCREVLERCQSEAMKRVDLYEQRMKRRSRVREAAM